MAQGRARGWRNRGHSPHCYHADLVPEKQKQHSPEERRKSFAIEWPSERWSMTLGLLGAQVGQA